MKSDHLSLCATNSHIEKELNRKTKPRFPGPMVVVHCTKGGAYILAELNGAVSRLRYAAFCIIPYLARFPDHIPVTSLLDDAELEDVRFIQTAFHLQMNHPRTPCSMFNFTQQPFIFMFPTDIPPMRHTPPNSNRPRISADPVFSFALVSSQFHLFQCLVSIFFSSMAPDQVFQNKNKNITDAEMSWFHIFFWLWTFFS